MDPFLLALLFLSVNWRSNTEYRYVLISTELNIDWGPSLVNLHVWGCWLFYDMCQQTPKRRYRRDGPLSIFSSPSTSQWVPRQVARQDLLFRSSWRLRFFFSFTNCDCDCDWLCPLVIKIRKFFYANNTRKIVFLLIKILSVMFLSPPDPTQGFSDISLQFETVLPDDETGFMETLCSNFLPFQT